eukprot:1156772-Pelagomonas_calceolata.AAC.13
MFKYLSSQVQGAFTAPLFLLHPSPLRRASSLALSAISFGSEQPSDSSDATLHGVLAFSQTSSRLTSRKGKGYLAVPAYGGSLAAAAG